MRAIDSHTKEVRNTDSRGCGNASVAALFTTMLLMLFIPNAGHAQCPDCVTPWDCLTGDWSGVHRCWIEVGEQCEGEGLCIFVPKVTEEEDANPLAAVLFEDLGIAHSELVKISTPDWGNLLFAPIRDDLLAAWTCRGELLSVMLESGPGMYVPLETTPFEDALSLRALVSAPG